MKQETLDRWQSIIDKQSNSGLSITDYCKRRNLSQTCFYKYKSALKNQLPKSEPVFIKAQPAMNHQAQAIRIEFNNTSINLPQSTQPDWLASFIKALA
jgi:hypothetical protein